MPVPVGSDHVEDAVTWEWQVQMRKQERAEVKAAILGGHLGVVYKKTAHQLISEMLEATEDEDITEAQWDALSGRGYNLLSELEKSAKTDLEVPVIRGGRKLLDRVG